MELVDKVDDSHELKKEETYVNEGHTIIVCRPIDWKVLHRLWKAMKPFFSPSRYKKVTGRRRTGPGYELNARSGTEEGNSESK